MGMYLCPVSDYRQQRFGQDSQGRPECDSAPPGQTPLRGQLASVEGKASVRRGTMRDMKKASQRSSGNKSESKNIAGELRAWGSSEKGRAYKSMGNQTLTHCAAHKMFHSTFQTTVFQIRD